MVDIKKRNALKVLGGTAVISSVPAFAAASENIFDVNGEAVALDETVVPVNASSDLSIALSVDPEPTVTLTNNSNKPLVVRHVHPGIVHAGRKTFDLNSIFTGSALTIAAGTSQSFKLDTTHATQAETWFPRERYRKQRLQVAALKGTDRFGEVVNSTRSYYS